MKGKKVTARDGNFKGRNLPNPTPRCNETNPAKGKDLGNGTEPIKGKLGS